MKVQSFVSHTASGLAADINNWNFQEIVDIKYTVCVIDNSMVEYAAFVHYKDKP